MRWLAECDRPMAERSSKPFPEQSTKPFPERNTKPFPERSRREQQRRQTIYLCGRDLSASFTVYPSTSSGQALRELDYRWLSEAEASNPSNSFIPS
ncbi:hypothetical protein [Pseudanabaena yagii]|uniref:Uncharacterized protein n=1 Tax=Pseudanabaena yagii GIHE-NHR1 TaxID=2722753 RepID=A0ABX1LPW8_9CYAN|nr:hypothetical protein [Pseudanabaena yagii]NMF58158.1 hypothetical protein [Pseudanabaena yagii GIHE-NHR1]